MIFVLFFLFSISAWSAESFEEILKHEPSSSYKIETIHNGSPISVIAPHGGNIEFGTTEIARSLAGKDWNFYSFSGLLSKGNRRLHITSSRFDEPRAIELAQQSDICITIHGFKDHKSGTHICFGGLNVKLRDKLYENLLAAKIQNIPNVNACEKFYGKHPKNIVNQCQRKGVQLEMSKSFRDRLLSDENLKNRFEAVVRQTLSEILN